MKVPPKVGEFDVIKFEKECSDYDNQLAADNCIVYTILYYLYI